MKRALVLSLVCWSVGCVTVLAADWPQWRGPGRDGISQEQGLLQSWPEGGPALRWQISDLGGGYSTPAVVGERLYLINNEGLENEYVEARSVADGSQIWSTRIGKVGNPDQRPNYPGARSTPTVDGQVLYALGSDGDLACVDTADGTIRWQKNLRTDFAGKPGTWAYSESPLVDGDVLVCTPGGSEATMVALAKQTGDVVWKSALSAGDAAGYASPIVVEYEGVKMYVQFLSNGLVGVAADSGELLWRDDRTAKGSPANIPTPVEVAGFVYSAAGRSGGGLVKLEVSGSGVEAQPVYFSPELPKGIGGTIQLGDYLYGTSDVMKCVEFTTGSIKWETRGIGAASLCYADGRLYLHGENGDAALVEPSAEGYRETGRFSPPNQPQRGQRARAWTYPVVAGGRLYLRDANMLWCYEIAAP